MKKQFLRILSFILISVTLVSAFALTFMVGAEDVPNVPTLAADVPEDEVVIAEQDYENTDVNKQFAIGWEASFDKQIVGMPDIKEIDGYSSGKVAVLDYKSRDWSKFVGNTSGGSVNITYPAGILYTGTSSKSDRLDYVPSKNDGYVFTIDFCNVTGFGGEYLWVCIYGADRNKIRGYQFESSNFDQGVWYRIKIVATKDGYTVTKTSLSGENIGKTEPLPYSSNVVSTSRTNQISVNMYPVKEGDISEERKSACFMIDNISLTTTGYKADAYDKVITEQDYENITLNTAHTYDDRNARTVPIVDSGIPELGKVADFNYADLKWSSASTNGYGGGRYYDAKSQVLPFVPSENDGFTVSFNFRNVTGYGGDDLWICVYNGEPGTTTSRGFRINTAQFDTGIWYAVKVTRKGNDWIATKTAITGDDAGTTTELIIQKKTAISTSTYNRVCYAFYNVDDTGTDENGQPTARREAHYQLDNFKLTTPVMPAIKLSFTPNEALPEGSVPMLIAYDTEGKVTAVTTGNVTSKSPTANAEFDITGNLSAYTSAASIKAVWWESLDGAKPLTKELDITDRIATSAKKSGESLTIDLDVSVNPSTTDTMSIMAYTVPYTYTDANIPDYDANKHKLIYADQSTSPYTKLIYDIDAYDMATEDIVVIINNGTEKKVTLLERVTPTAITNIVIQLGADQSKLNFTWYSVSDDIGEIVYAKESELVNGKLPADAKVAVADRTPSIKTNYYGNKGTIDGLEAGTTYYYVIRNGADETEPMPITTAGGSSFSFVFAGDPQIGRGYGNDASQNISCIEGDGVAWGRTLSQIVNAREFQGVSFLMSAGDQINTYLQDYEKHLLQWDAYTNHEELKSLPTVTVLGNHDNEPYSIYPYQTNQPNMLTKPDGSYYGETWETWGISTVKSADYYFTYNNVLFIVLNTNTFTARDDSDAATAKDRAAAEEHAAFIEAVMEKEAGREFNWTIVLYHQSPFGSSYHGNYKVNADGTYKRDEQYAFLNMREFLIPVLYENGVDLILSGHDHSYARSHVLKPVKDEFGNYTTESVISAYEDGSYVFEDGTTEPKFITWRDANGDVYTDLKVSSKPISVTNPDGIVHITGATSSGSQPNAAEFEHPYNAVKSTANTRQISRIDITEDSLTIVTYNLGTKTTDNITLIDTFTIYHTEEAPENPKETAISGASLQIGSDLSMKYYVTLADAIDPSRLSMRFTMNGKTSVTSDYEIIGERYVFTFLGIAPQMMGDNITAELLLDGEVICVKDNYSVKANLLSILEKSDDEALDVLIADLINYGASAQKYVGYNTDALVNEGLTLEGSTIIPTEEDLNRSATESLDKDRFAVAVGVRFDYANKIYVKLNLPSTDGVSVYINSEKADITHYSGNTYIAYSSDIRTTDFDTEYYISIVYGGVEIQNVTYSVNSYAYTMYEDAAIGELALALYRLGVSSDIYKSK